MNEKVEWEIVDETAPRRNAHEAWQSAPDASGAPGLTGLAQAMLGRWWRWKVAGFALLAAVALVLVAIFAGVFVLAGMAALLLSVAVAKARRLFGRHGSSIAPRP